jgi:hypothetical protein
MDKKEVSPVLNRIKIYKKTKIANGLAKVWQLQLKKACNT